MHIADIGRVSGSSAAAGYIGDGFAAGIDAAAGHARAAGDGQTIVVYFGVAHGNAAVAAQVDRFSQFDGQSVVAIRHNANVALGQGAGITAFHVNRFAQLAINRRAAVARKGERLVGLVVRHFNGIVDVAFTGAADVGIGVNAGARIISGVAADDVLHTFALCKQLAAVDGIG